LAGTHPPVGAVDARRHHVDDDLASARDWIGQVAVLQDFRTAEPVDVGRFHACHPSRLTLLEF
jgi:hypothetical protein